MDIFDRFRSREELLRAVESAIESEKAPPEDAADGKPAEYFFLRRNGAESRPDSQYAAELRGARRRLSESEARVRELAQENARLAATNEEFSKYNPEKQRDEINRLLEEVGRLKADNKGLTEQIAPLTQLIADYKQKEDERTIEKAIIDEAAKLGVRPEAMRDVMFRRSLLTVSDLGTVQTKADGIGIAEFMKAEYDASPLWHPQSQGGGSSPGAGGTVPNGELYREAVRNNDFEGMIANAPEFKGVTLS